LCAYSERLQSAIDSRTDQNIDCCRTDSLTWV
jgi:hypothetical protein